MFKNKWDTEDKIEREAERMMDRLDAAFLAEGSDMTIEEYHLQTEEIELWTKLRYRELRYA
jgi:hypothetical protein